MPKVKSALVDRNAKILAQANPAYERINAAWETAEAYIQKLGVLAPVEHCYETHRYMSYYIGVQKRSGKWRVCHGTYDEEEAIRFEHETQNEDYEYGTTWTALSDCHIDLRVALIKHLGALIEAVVESNEKVVPTLLKSADEMEATLKDLGIA